MTVKILRLRSGTYFPSFLEPHKLSVQATGMSGISKSEVSKLGSELDERVRSFLKRGPTGRWT